MQEYIPQIQYDTFVGPLPKENYDSVTTEFNLFRQDRVVEAIARARYGEEIARKTLAEKEADRYDDITGILKGPVFRTEANFALARLDPQERRMLRPNNAFIAQFDGKGLKKRNDTLGHEAGNAMLYNIGQIITSVAREDDIVGRLGEGSDEFGAIYFFRDDLIQPEEMQANLNDAIMEKVQAAVKRGDITGLKWKLQPFIKGVNIRNHLALADPIPGCEDLFEYPSPEELPSRK